MRIKAHPFSELIPRPTQAERERLVEHIRTHGQLEPVVLLDGMILDGNSRYEACVSLDFTPKTRLWTVEDGDPMEFVLAKNLHRRHLTTSQQAMVLAKATSQREAKTKDAKTGRFTEHGTARLDEIAKKANLSPSTLTEARTILADGTPADVEAVETGERTVNDVHREIRTRKETTRAHLDRTGYPIPDDCYDDWRRAETEGAEMVRAIDDMSERVDRGLQDNDVVYRELNPGTLADLRNLRMDIKQLIPYAVCTTCQGREVTRTRCAHCKQRGFLSELWWKTVPEEVKEMRAKLVCAESEPEAGSDAGDRPPTP